MKVGTLDIAMPNGMTHVTPQTAEEIGGELHEMWGATFPDLFEPDSGSG